MQQQRTFEQRDSNPSQLESHKQDYSGISIKCNKVSINQENRVAKGLVQHAKAICSYRIFVKESFQDILQGVLIALCKRVWFDDNEVAAH